MILGIDGSNARAGGGLTYLVELLNHSKPSEFGCKEVIVWASETTLSNLEDNPWLTRKNHFLLNQSLLFRIIWQKFYLSRQAKKYCDILFLPSGNTARFHPYVSMCQNLLPFEPEEKANFGFSLSRLRYELLKWNQCKSFTKAEGVVFLSNYSLKVVERVCGKVRNLKIIPHGVSEIFRTKEVHMVPKNGAINILYVSIINHYKHQDKVVEAVYKLIDLGYNITLTLVGASYPPALKKLRIAIDKRPEYSGNIILIDKVPYEDLMKYYHNADLFVFASSCETFGMILLEAMSSGLPIACSSKSSMKEVSGDAALYFNPFDVGDIVISIKKFLKDPLLMQRMAEEAQNRSFNFSWDTCAESTFEYVSEVYNTYSGETAKTE